MGFSIPVELFITFLGGALVMAIIGLIRQPQIPAMIAFGGMFILTMAVSTDTIIMGYSGVSDTSAVYYNVQSFTGAVNVNSGQSQSIYAENVVDSSSMLYQKTVNCAQWLIKKSGSPPLSSIITFGVWDNSGNLKYTFGTMNVTYLSTATTPFEMCNTSTSYTFAVSDRVGIKYPSGNSTNTLLLSADGNNPYDDGHTIANLWNGASWTTSSTLDISGMIRFFDSNSSNTQFDFQFTELPKTLFALFGTILILAGALMVYRE